MEDIECGRLQDGERQVQSPDRGLARSASCQPRRGRETRALTLSAAAWPSPEPPLAWLVRTRRPRMASGSEWRRADDHPNAPRVRGRDAERAGPSRAGVGFRWSAGLTSGKAVRRERWEPLFFRPFLVGARGFEPPTPTVSR